MLACHVLNSMLLWLWLCIGFPVWDPASRFLCPLCSRSAATHLADSMANSPIRQPTTRTRSSTLQDCLGAHQNLLGIVMFRVGNTA